MFETFDFSIDRRNDFESVHLLNISNFAPLYRETLTRQRAQFAVRRLCGVVASEGDRPVPDAQAARPLRSTRPGALSVA